MSEKETGGPAFPYVDDGWLQPGMHLRDYFAAKALQGFCANPSVFASNSMCGWGLVNCKEKDLCEIAYGIADSMIEARK